MRILAVACFAGWGPVYGGPQRLAGLLGAIGEVHAPALEPAGHRDWLSVASKPAVTLIHPAFSADAVRDWRPRAGCRQIGVDVAGDYARATDLPRGTKDVSLADIALARGGPEAFPRLAHRINEAADDVAAIWCFQPYLYPFVEGLGLPVVLDAMDIEADVKAASMGEGDPRRAQLAFVREIEARACGGAAAVTVLTEEDAARLDALYGVPPDRIHRVGNGATMGNPSRPPAGERAQARRSLGIAEDARTALFFSSAHPPNVEIARWIADWLAPRVPSVTFVLAGSVAWPLTHSTAGHPNVRLLHNAPPELRGAIYTAAEAGLNPVRRRLPGSDVKILDYMSHAVPVLATARGVRGHDLEAGLHYYPMDEDAPGAVWKVLHDDELANHLAHHGHLRAEALNWHSQADRAMEVLRAVIDTGRTQRGSAGVLAARIEAGPDNTAQSLADFRHNAPTANGYPTEICFDLTNDCHLRCTHCYRTYMQNAATYLPLAAFERVPDAFLQNARQIELSGMGEPMLHPDWDAILERVAADGRPLVTFNSSFTIYNDHKLRRMVELGTSPAVSVDGARPETFERIRVRARHEKVFGAMRRLMALAREIQHPRFHLRVQWTLYKHNLTELAEFMDFAGPIGIPEVRVQPLAPHQPQMREWCCDLADPATALHIRAAFEKATRHGVRLTMHEHLLADECVRAAALVNHGSAAPAPIRDWHRHPDSRGCSFPWTQLNIDSAGYLVACCFSDARFGNILHDDLDALWNGHRMAELRAAVNGDKPARWCVDSPSAGVCCPRVQYLKSEIGKSQFLQSARAST